MSHCLQFYLTLNHLTMETIREELNHQQIAKIESIKARIAELDKYKIELEEFYKKLKSELGKRDT